jgi:hypothetical protein
MGINGGKRPGAGRKSNVAKLLAAKFAAPFFSELEQTKHWKSLLASGDEKVRLDTVKYLTDRLYGKSPQSVDLNANLDIITRVVSDL